MTYIEEIRNAVGLLRNICMEHKCSDCPLLGVTMVIAYITLPVGGLI